MPAPLSQPSDAQIKSLSEIFTPDVEKEQDANAGEKQNTENAGDTQRVRTTEGAQQ